MSSKSLSFPLALSLAFAFCFDVGTLKMTCILKQLVSIMKVIVNLKLRCYDESFRELEYVGKWFEF